MRVLLLLLALVVSVPTQAADRSIRGMGLLGCKTYLDTRQKRIESTDLEYASWMTGFLSGYVSFRDSDQAAQFTVPPPGTILTFVDDHCRRNPSGTVAQGLNALIAHSLIARMGELTSSAK